MLPATEQADPTCGALLNAERNAQAKILERASWLRAKRLDQLHGFKRLPMKAFQAAMLMAPYYPCFWTLKKDPSVRHLFDGGKWLCGTEELSTASSPCVVYSFGSNYNTMFEDHIHKASRGSCEFFIFDPTMAVTKSQADLDRWRASLPKNYHFFETAVTGNSALTNVSFSSVYGGGKKSYPTTTLDEAMRANGHASATILKFDIDGFEHELLRSAPWSHLRFGLILFEVHAVQHVAGSGKKPQPLLFQDAHRAFGRLERAGYRMYSAEPVYVGPNGQGAGAWEVAFVHRDWSPRSAFLAEPCPNITRPWPWWAWDEGAWDDDDNHAERPHGNVTR